MKVLKKQTNSSDCIVCGMNNELGLKVQFYEMENGYLVGCFKGINEHQSFPGRMHGGVISAILDEGIGRAIWSFEPNTWGVTTHLKVKYRKPVPLNEELMLISKINENKKRLFEGSGIIVNKEHQILAEATAIFFKMPLDKIATENIEHDKIDKLYPDNVNEIDIDDIIL